MKYRNDFKKPIKIRTGNMSNCIWKTINPGEVMNLPWHIGEPYGLTKVKDHVPKTEKKKEEPIVEEKKIEPEKPDEDFKKILMDIKGVGPKSAEDILRKYPTEEKLEEAIKAGEEVHDNDRINELIKYYYSDE